MDKRARIITLISTIVFLLGVAAIIFFCRNKPYTATILLFLIISSLLLCILSIPKKIVVTDETIEIRCIVELTRIRFSELHSVKRIERDAMRRRIPIMGIFGFFGYYGYFFDTSRWNTMLLYCKQWDNFVEFTDIYEKTYIVSSPDPDGLTEYVNQILNKRTME